MLKDSSATYYRKNTKKGSSKVSQLLQREKRQKELRTKEHEEERLVEYRKKYKMWNNKTGLQKRTV